MNITEIKIHKLTDSKVLALVSITIDDEFVVTGLKILNGKNGMWVAYPNRKNQEGEYKDIAFPITKAARENIQEAVLAKYVPFSDEDKFASDSAKEIYNDINKSKEQKAYDPNDSDGLPF